MGFHMMTDPFQNRSEKFTTMNIFIYILLENFNIDEYYLVKKRNIFINVTLKKVKSGFCLS